jgi:hypothetical protein
MEDIMFENITKIIVLSDDNLLNSNTNIILLEDGIKIETWLANNDKTLKLVLSRRKTKLVKNLKDKCIGCKHRVIEHQYEDDSCNKLGINLIDSVLQYVNTKRCFEFNKEK